MVPGWSAHTRCQNLQLLLMQLLLTAVGIALFLGAQAISPELV